MHNCGSGCVKPSGSSASAARCPAKGPRQLRSVSSWAAPSRTSPHPRRPEILARARTASAIEIVGYTDNTGSDAVNKRIALARAQLVKDMLVRSGISPAIIKVREQAGVYYATNDTAEGRAANRRAIVTFK